MVMKILLKDILLDKWGPYIDPQRIKFSVDPVKNVTYIIWKNSCGKTKLFQAINWVLFGEVENLRDKVNQKMKDKGEVFEMKVELSFSMEHISTGSVYDYVITRFVKFKGEEQLGNVSLLVKTFEIGKNKPFFMSNDDFEKMIQKYIPMGPREYFFLDGENLVHIFLKNIETIKKLATDNSVIPKLEKTVGFLKDINQNIVQKIKKLTKKDKALTKNYEELEKINEETDKINKKNQQLTDFINDIERKRKDVELKLQGANINLYDRREELKNELEELENQKSVTLNSIESDFQNWLVPLLLENEITFCLEDLQKKQREKKIPSIISDAVIDEILKDENCICGRKLTEKERIHLNKLKEILGHNRAGDLIAIEFMKSLSDTKKSINEIKSNLKKNQIRLRQLNLQIMQKKDKLSKLGRSDTSVKQLIDDLRSFSEQIKELEHEIDENNSKIMDLSRQKAKVERNIKKAKTELQKKLLKGNSIDFNELNDKIYFEEKTRNFLERLIETTTNLIDKEKDFIKSEIEKRTNKKFIQFIWNPEEWNGILIDEDWKFYGIQKDETKIKARELSKGQRHMLGIAFLSSLPGITELEIPFLFDSPFGGISDEPVAKVGKYLPSIMKGTQIIILVTDSEHKNVYPYIEEKVGIKYELRYNDGATSPIELPIN